jgi:glycosyltransferase involved in cell wall biosynthesis
VRVLHIITSLTDGGAEGVLYRLCTNSPGQLHTIVSLTGEGKYGPLLREAGLTVYALNQRRGRLSLRALARLYRLIRSERPDVVQTWMYHSDLVGGLVARAAGNRNVCWNVRNSSLAVGRTPRLTIQTVRLCARLSRRVPAKIVFCAQRAAAVHAAIGYDTTKFVLIPNGIEGKRFVPAPDAGARWRESNGFSTDTPLIGMVARFDPQKDHPNLMEALRRVKAAEEQFACVLIGSDITAANAPLVKLVRAAGLEDQVQLLGPREDVPAAMNALDLHVLSSAYGEAFPNVVAESMACGTPNVVTDVGDAGQIVGDTGWTVPHSSPDALAGAIIEALRELAVQSRWSARSAAAARRVAEGYSLGAMVSAYSRLWSEVARFERHRV